ncbi:Protein Sprint, partial [Aphelenchoides avenae]
AHLNNSIDDLPITIPQLSPVISPPRLRNTHNKNSEPGVRIQKYVESLAADETTVFGATLQRFIECTVEAEESDPYVVIRNVRQFLNGIKNYLVKHGEGDLHFLIERESAKLNANEFLNIDAILEAVLHKILLVPVKPHLYHLMVRENSRSGALQSLSENLAHVRGMKPDQLGFPDGTRMPEPRQMEQIRLCLRKMQHHYSPLKKLENLLRALSHVVSRPARAPVGKRHPSSGDLSGAFGGKSKKLPPADELIRWLVYLLARTSSVGCEVEAWYMWELLPQQLLTTGDAAYYLSTLFSAIHVLKHPDSLRRLKNIPDNVACMGPQMPKTNGNSEETSDAFIRIAVPDEQAGSIEYHTFPAVSQMNAAKLCRVIAHQFAITNPEDYGLYILFDGFETCLLANECPDVVRDQLSEAGKSYLFAYKRHDAKIAWPKNIVQSSANNAPPHQAAAALIGDHHLV